MEKTRQKNSYKAPALEKGLDILELLANCDEFLSTQQIAERLGRSTQEIFRMLVILRERKYLLQNQQGQYHLSPRLFQLSHQHSLLDKLVRYAQPLMRSLCEKTLQSCHVSIFNEGSLLVVAQQNPPYKMHFSLRLGASIDLCVSGSGATALAFCSEEQRQYQINTSAASTQEKEVVLMELPKIARQGYYLAACPQTPGVTNIVYPIFTTGQELVAVIAIPFLVMHLEQQKTQRQLFEAGRQELEQVARELSFYLGAE